MSCSLELQMLIFIEQVRGEEEGQYSRWPCLAMFSIAKQSSQDLLHCHIWKLSCVHEVILVIRIRIFMAITELHGDSLADPDGVPLGPALLLLASFCGSCGWLRGRHKRGTSGGGEAFL